MTEVGQAVVSDGEQDWGTPRTKTVTWYDPEMTAAAGSGLSGLEFLQCPRRRQAAAGAAGAAARVPRGRGRGGPGGLRGNSRRVGLQRARHGARRVGLRRGRHGGGAGRADHARGGRRVHLDRPQRQLHPAGNQGQRHPASGGHGRQARPPGRVLPGGDLRRRGQGRRHRHQQLPDHAGRRPTRAPARRLGRWAIRGG